MNFVSEDILTRNGFGLATDVREIWVSFNNGFSGGREQLIHTGGV